MGEYRNGEWVFVEGDMLPTHPKADPARISRYLEFAARSKAREMAQSGDAIHPSEAWTALTDLSPNPIPRQLRSRLMRIIGEETFGAWDQ